MYGWSQYEVEFYKPLKEECKCDYPDSPKLMTFSSYRLHVVHNIFETGFLKTNLLVNVCSPDVLITSLRITCTKRDYGKETISDMFPQNFVLPIG